MTIDRIDTTQDRDSQTVYHIQTEYEKFHTSETEVAERYCNMARVTAVTRGEQA